MAPSTLASLLARTEIDDHEEILKAANTALKGSTNNEEAQRAKLISLLKLERYEDALESLKKGSPQLQQSCRFEKAYALYKAGNLEEARQIAREIEDHRGARHVEAQAAYRLERFEEASSIYRQLSTGNQPAKTEEGDLRVNLGAIHAQLQWQLPEAEVSSKPSREDLEAFETSFNAACRSIASGELAQAEVLLKRAKDLCNALDELSDAQKAEELVPIEVQQVYVLYSLGKHEAAEKIASQIAVKDIMDTLTKRIAQINQVATSEKPNPYLCQKLFQDLGPLPKSDNLFQYQTNILQESELALDLMINKPSVVLRSTTQGMVDNLPSTSAHINKLSVLNTAAQAQNELGKMGLKRILPLIERRPLDIGLVMVIVHLYLLTGNKGSAVTVMDSLLKRLEASTEEKDQDVRFAPGFVAAAVSLYSLDDRKSQVKSELAKAARYWRHKSKPPPNMLQTCGRSLLESGDKQAQLDARDIFDKLYEQSPDDKRVIAGYVAAWSQNPSTCAKQSDKLTAVERLVAGIDVDSLDSAGVPQDPKSSILNASQKRALDEKPKPAKKRVRKSRLPKDLDPNKAPDPERWLPMKDRSYYKPKKGKKGKQKAAALTQGGISEKDGEKQDKPASAGVIQAAGGASKGSSKNKKKKGKK